MSGPRDGGDRLHRRRLDGCCGVAGDRGGGSRSIPAAVVVVALVLLLGLGSVLAAGRAWWGEVMGPGDPRPLVVASTTILADLATQVGGSRVRVHSLLAPGQDPHSYEPVPRDALALTRAQVVLLNGYGIDIWAERLLQGLPAAREAVGVGLPGGAPQAEAGGLQAGARQAAAGELPLGAGQAAAGSLLAGRGQRAGAGLSPAAPQETGDDRGDRSHPAGRPGRGGGPLVVRVAEGLPADVTLPWPGDPQRTDPHLWMDPVLVTGFVDGIRDALSAVDPAGAAFYRQRAAAFKEELKALDAWIARQVAQVPPHRRLLVTTHDAYRYFGRRYGLQVVDTVWGVSTEEEPAAADLARLMGHLRQYGVPAFVESTINPKLMEELAAQAGVPIGGRLYADSVGPPGSGAETYVGMMRQNVQVITGALMASSPPSSPDASRP